LAGGAYVRAAVKNSGGDRWAPAQSVEIAIAADDLRLLHR